MKKIILISSVLVLLAAGCSKQPPMVPETIKPCDVDRNGDCNQQDKGIITGLLGQCIGSPTYNTLADADHDGCINLADLAQLFPEPTNQPPPIVQQQNQATSTPSKQPLKDISSFQVYLTVEGSNLNKDYVFALPGENALVFLKDYHKVETKSYSGIGEMVLSIDGNKADSKHFWEFFVNGKSSSVGASSYVLKAGDKIEWKLSEIK